LVLTYILCLKQLFKLFALPASLTNMATNANFLSLKYVAVVAAYAAVLSASGVAFAMDLNGDRWGHPQNALFNSTYLIDVKQDNGHSRRLTPLQQAGFESAQGDWVSFYPWYSSAWKDTHVTLLTQLGSEFGFIWGVGTGERGAKYSISPSLRLGGIYRVALQKNTFFTFKASALLGAQLKEKPCTADYGDIGGSQEVNCRLAASTLSPASTLPFLFNEPSDNKTQVLFQFNHRF
jgi:hypothetical protein